MVPFTENPFRVPSDKTTRGTNVNTGGVNSLVLPLIHVHYLDPV